MTGNILIIDDDLQLAKQLQIILEHHKYEVETAVTAKKGRELMESNQPDIALLDLQLPDANGVQLLEELSTDFPFTKFIIITAFGSIRSAVTTTHLGAQDYLEKPFEPAKLLHSVKKALKESKREAELKRLREGSDKFTLLASSDNSYSNLSPSMEKVFQLAEKATQNNSTVLLLGETGVGKDHLAKWIHLQSPRKNESFFSINCSAISSNLAESELFGHEPGSFTGNQGRKHGILELAPNGTLLLNEIGELDQGTQAKLLTFLDTSKFMRVGGHKQIQVNTRIIAATNRDLKKEVEKGKFREDLYYRLNILPIHIPPLRERKKDIKLLMEELIHTLKIKLGLTHSPSLSQTAMKMILQYNWPGNVRELKNILERAIILSNSSTINSEHLNIPLVSKKRDTIKTELPVNKGIDTTLKSIEKELIINALKITKTKKEAAKKLKISRHSLNYRLKSLNIDADKLYPKNYLPQ